jgi:AraC-like DNA-binding protein
VPHFAARRWPFSDVVAARTGNSVIAVRDRLVRDVSGRHAKRGRCDLQDPAAKRLLDDTALRLSDIAFAAGFGSILRFNAAFRSTNGRPPSSFRCSARSDKARTLRSAGRLP